MSVLVRNELQVGSNILTQSKNMVVNSIMEILLELAFLRNLDPAYLMSTRKGLEDAMYVWLHEQSLRGVIFEVSLPGGSNALEHWDTSIAYSDTPDSEVKRAPTAALKHFCETLKNLPPGSSYDIICRVTRDAKEVPGWVTGKAKNINPTVEKNFGAFGYGTIKGQLHYRAEAF
jgi:hypothetical protein